MTHMSRKMPFALGVAMAALALAPAAAGQLASRPAEEWVKTLEAPARVAALKTDEVVAALELKPGDVVADLGAGTGLFALPLAKAVTSSGKVYAVEIDDGFLTLIRRKAGEQKVANLVTVSGKPTDPGLPARDVDVAFFHDVLHHVENRTEYLKNVVRYVEPAGRVVVIDYDTATSPHKDQPALVVSREQAITWMDDLGFTLSREPKVFTDKYFLVFTKR
jgi:ubiquinone/menaquinone biosynthesis C-methylase UbiE